MIEKQFINEDNLQIAMTEYKNLSVGKDVLTEYNKTDKIQAYYHMSSLKFKF